MALLAALVSAACSTTTSNNTYYGLTQDQINLIVPVITSAAVGPMLAVLPAKPSAGFAAPPLTAVNITIDSTTPCPVSGGIRMAGSATGDAAQSGTLSVGGRRPWRSAPSARTRQLTRPSIRSSPSRL
jgi:hypothetical protein